MTALAVSAAVVDASPFSPIGAFVLANCPPRDEDQMFRDLWGMAMVVTAPLATWVLFVLTG